MYDINFCHPANLDGMDKSLPYCIKEMNKDTCVSKGCVWSTGKSFKPETSFCGAVDVSPYGEQNLLTCPTKDQATCSGPCEWYQGVDSPTTPVVPPTAGCAPPVDTPAPMCHIPLKPATSTSSTAIPAHDVPSHWSDTACTFVCPAGGSMKPQPMFTYPFCHPDIQEVTAKASW